MLPPYLRAQLTKAQKIRLLQFQNKSAPLRNPCRATYSLKSEWQNPAIMSQQPLLVGE